MENYSIVNGSSVQICTFIFHNVNTDPIGVPIFARKIKKPLKISKSCCIACAFKEEQIYQKTNTTSFLAKFIQLLVDKLVARLSPKSSIKRQSLYDFSKRLPYSSFLSLGFLLFGTKVFGKEISEEHLYSNDVRSIPINSVILFCIAALAITAAFKNRMNANDNRNIENEERTSLWSNNYHPKGYDREDELLRQNRYAQILSSSIQCKTISYDVGDDEDGSLRKECYNELKRLHAILRESFPVLYQRYPPSIIASYSLLFTIPGSNADAKPIMLCSHLDVVPAPNSIDECGKRPWIHNPFGGIIEDDMIWGRGGKSNLVIFLS